MFAFIREISEATALLTEIKAEVQTALDLITGRCSTTAPTIVLLKDALKRLEQCAALPNVQALPDRPKHEIFGYNAETGKFDIPLNDAAKADKDHSAI